MIWDDSFSLFFGSPVRSLCHTCDVVHHLSSVIRHVLSVSTITTRNNKDIKSVFGANVHHVPGLCLLGMVVPPTLVIKLWLKNQIFTFSTSSLKLPADGALYYARRFSNLGYHNLLKL